MMKRRLTETEYVDDGRTVADMSYFAEQQGQSSPAGGISGEPGATYTRKETFWAVLGALAATLAIGLVYVIGLGLVVLIMYLAIKARS